MAYHRNVKKFQEKTVKEELGPSLIKNITDETIPRIKRGVSYEHACHVHTEVREVSRLS